MLVSVFIICDMENERGVAIFLWVLNYLASNPVLLMLVLFFSAIQLGRVSVQHLSMTPFRFGNVFTYDITCRDVV